MFYSWQLYICFNHDFKNAYISVNLYSTIRVYICSQIEFTNWNSDQSALLLSAFCYYMNDDIFLFWKCNSKLQTRMLNRKFLVKKRNKEIHNSIFPETQLKITNLYVKQKADSLSTINYFMSIIISQIKRISRFPSRNLCTGPYLVIPLLVAIIRMGAMSDSRALFRKEKHSMSSMCTSSINNTYNRKNSSNCRSDIPLQFFSINSF